MVGVFVAFIRVVYGRMIYMSLPKRTFCFLFRYDRTSVTPVMEQIEGPMNIVASSSVHVNTCGRGGGGGEGLGSYPLPGVVGGIMTELI